MLEKYIEQKKQEERKKRELITASKVIDMFPEGITITKITRFRDSEGKTQYGINIRENDDVWFYAPTSLSKIITTILDEEGISLNELVDIIHEEHGRYIFKKVKTKKGRTYITTQFDKCGNYDD